MVPPPFRFPPPEPPPVMSLPDGMLCPFTPREDCRANPGPAPLRRPHGGGARSDEAGWVPSRATAPAAAPAGSRVLRQPGTLTRLTADPGLRPHPRATSRRPPDYDP